MKNFVIVIAALTATTAKAEVITKDEARFFGYLIASDAVCGTRRAALDLSVFLNKGASLKDFKALKTEIVSGERFGKAAFKEKGKEDFCPKSSLPETQRDHASDARVLGYVAAEDELCGTHIYNGFMEGKKKRGEIYPGLLQDYADEFAEGKRLQSHEFEVEGETKFCRDDRNREREDADFERVTRALGVYPPAHGD